MKLCAVLRIKSVLVQMSALVNLIQGSLVKIAQNQVFFVPLFKLSVLCPNLNNCNGNGVCTSPTECLCSGNFGGADCRTQINVPDAIGSTIGLIVGLLIVVVVALGLGLGFIV